MLAFTIALGIALTGLLAVWIAISMQPSRGSTAGTASNFRRVEQPESTYGSNGAAYGRRLERFEWELDRFARSTRTPENVTGNQAAAWAVLAMRLSLCSNPFDSGPLEWWFLTTTYRREL
jgi:hypothetical protein